MDSSNPEKPKKTSRKAEPRAQLTVKLGDGEVRFEAGLKAVQERFDGAVERLFESWQPAESTPANRTTHPAVAMRLMAQEAAPSSTAPAPAIEVGDEEPKLTLDPGEVAECFTVNASDELSLRLLPRGMKPQERNADALLLLIYGMLALQGQELVTAPALVRSARQSGLELDRASRLLHKRRRHIFTVGRRRGKRYGLTAVGIQHCEGLLELLRERLKAR